MTWERSGAPTEGSDAIADPETVVRCCTTEGAHEETRARMAMAASDAEPAPSAQEVRPGEGIQGGG